jgi:hypothetical protein
LFRLGEEPIENRSLPGLICGRDGDAPLRPVEEDFGRDIAGHRRFPEGVEGGRIESIDPLGHPPGSQSAHDADMLNLQDDDLEQHKCPRPQL